MIDFTLLQGFGIAILLGALIGLEREYSKNKKHAHDYAGIRTFPLIALFGALSAYLSNLFSIYILVASVVIMGSLIIASYLVINKNTQRNLGATSEVAGFLTFFIGVIAMQGHTQLAVLLGVAITIILYLRSFLHKFAKHIKGKELADTLKFIVVAFVILPFLPNQGFGPHQIFNPYIIWLMVVFISGISFFGYILMKWIGEKGITLAGILGGLISSTAVTTSFAARSKLKPKLFKPLALGVILANGIMFIRILLEVFVLNRALFWNMLIPMLTLAAITGVFAYFVWKKAENLEGKIDLKSPFRLAPALKFGAFFAMILALVKLADVYLSTKGVYLVSIISGFADVDAITVSLSQLAKKTLDMTTARNGIILAALMNVAVKGGIAFWMGGKQFWRIVVGLFSALIVVGVLFLVFL
jgi:uncharacterized membrane protein (DUF4010 family)